MTCFINKLNRLVRINYWVNVMFGLDELNEMVWAPGESRKLPPNLVLQDATNSRTQETLRADVLLPNLPNNHQGWWQD